MTRDMKRVRENARAASTEDLLDRVGPFRHEYEPEAILGIEEELASRSVSQEEIAAHCADRMASALRGRDGHAEHCWACRRPATGRQTGWIRLFWVIPVFPVARPCCASHGSQSESGERRT